MDALVFTEWMEKLTEELGKKLEEVCNKIFKQTKKFNSNTFLNFYFLFTGAWQCRHSQTDGS